MSIEQRGAMPLDYHLVGYPGSALRFRGPAADLSRPHVLCLGGAETFGRFVPAPYPAQLRVRLGVPVANLGVPHAGLDLALGDPAVTAAMRTSRAIVLQLPGAQNMSNRFFTVHPRRNDRFVEASTRLRNLYPEVDFTEFHFTRHLLSQLKVLSRDRFAEIRRDLQSEWQSRLTAFLAAAPAPVHLLWLARRVPETPEPREGIGADPAFVTQAMLDAVAACAASLGVVADRPARGEGRRGLFAGWQEEGAARMLPGTRAHEAACAAIAGRLGEV